MDAEKLRRIGADPTFIRLERQRARLAWTLTAVVFFAYMTFILVIAFAPAWFGRPVPGFTYMTLGIPVGISLILLGIITTGIYVWRANHHFDLRLSELLQHHDKPANDRPVSDALRDSQ